MQAQQASLLRKSKIKNFTPSSEAKLTALARPPKNSVVLWSDLRKTTHGDFVLFRFFQRLFQKSHASTGDLWNMDTHLAHIILPKLSAFRAQNLHSYPEEVERAQKGFELFGNYFNHLMD